MIIALCCYFITLAFALFFALSYYTHMFQLEAYLKKQFFKWLNGNFLSLLLKSAFFVISFFILLFNRNIISYAVCSVLNLAESYLFKPFKAKKPLVYTARVKRLLATAYLLFAAASALLLIFDILFLLPLICVFCGYILILCDIINKPAEKAVRNRYINEAKNIIKSRKNSLTVIGITGSYGKTSTKYFLDKILSQKYNVLMTPASYNSTMGVVKTVREMLKPSHE
ncbi:MAG: UDP-N-acetylmuramoyl-tripeptide--D-alanyl-D-alanine ligase, partial [Clostridia bacterium]|nr:UDP-N-acetylmuramoyl-tripeptide--D-alanyl-D-alanine ligase [Clostridia bacterium]